MQLCGYKTLCDLRSDADTDVEAIQKSSFGELIVLRNIGRWDSNAIEEYISLEKNGSIQNDGLFDSDFVKRYYPTTIRRDESALAFICRSASKPWCYPTEDRVRADADIIRNSQYYDGNYVLQQVGGLSPSLNVAIYYCTELFRYNVNPSRDFLVLPYLIINGDLGEAEVNGLLQYEAAGRAEGRLVFAADTVNETFGAFRVEVDPIRNRPIEGALIHAARGGLMNRLIPALSTIIEARNMNRSPILCWAPDTHCAAHFHDLFEIDFTSIIKIASDRLPVGAVDYWINHLDRAVPPVFPSTKASALIVQSVSAYSKGTDPASNLSEFGQIWEKLIFSAPVRQMLEDAPTIESISTIGLHVRRPYENGFEAALENSKFKVPLERYLDVVQRVREAFPVLEHVFLCSNSPAAEREISSNLSNTILRDKDSYDNTISHVAVQDALADSILLSKCRLVISQEASSFGYFASIINKGFCLFVMNDNERPVVDVYKLGTKIASIRIDDNFSTEIQRYIVL